MKRRTILLRSDEAKPYMRQHKSPCSDCPWARKSVPGWLGPNTIEEWLAEAHSDGYIACHTRLVSRAVTGRYGDPVANTVSMMCNGHWQCAGGAIYRANVCKTPRNPLVLQLPADKVKVFTWQEFERHHADKRPVLWLDKEDQ